MTRRKLFGYALSVLRVASPVLIAIALTMSLLGIIQVVFSPFHAIASNSMAPAIETGDAVLLKEINARNVNVGEVVIYVDPQDRRNLIIHRVVEKNYKGKTPFYITKGDNNPVADPCPVFPGMIVGAPSYHIPGFGHLLDFLTTLKGYTIFVIIPGSLAFIIAFALGWVEKREEKAVIPHFAAMPCGGRKLMNLQ